MRQAIIDAIVDNVAVTHNIEYGSIVEGIEEAADDIMLLIEKQAQQAEAKPVAKVAPKPAAKAKPKGK